MIERMPNINQWRRSFLIEALLLFMSTLGRINFLQKWGLEIGALAAIDIDNHTAFHLEAIQTLNTVDQSFADWYAGIISDLCDSQLYYMALWPLKI